MLSLKDGTLVKLDEKDFERYKDVGWFQHHTGSICGWHEGKLQYLHRLVAEVPPKVNVKFLNNDKTDCRKENLSFTLAHTDGKNWRDINLRRKYGITEKDYEKLLAKQNGKCAICGFTPYDRAKFEGKLGKQGSLPINYRNLHVDHCHKTGKVRGLLCWSCNVGLGKFFDNPNTLKEAAKYVS